MTRNDKLKQNSDSSCDQNRQITKKCKPKSAKPTKGKGNWDRIVSIFILFLLVLNSSGNHKISDVNLPSFIVDIKRKSSVRILCSFVVVYLWGRFQLIFLQFTRFSVLICVIFYSRSQGSPVRRRRASIKKNNINPVISTFFPFTYYHY